MNWKNFEEFKLEQLSEETTINGRTKRIEVLCLVEYNPPIGKSYEGHIVLTYCRERKQLVYARHNYSVFDGYIYEDEFCKILKYIILN